MFGAIVVTAFSCNFARSAQVAYDSAGDSAYNSAAAGGTFQGVNGGYGWGGGWAIDGPGFIGSSSTNGTGDPTGSGDINSPRTPLGRAWGLHADYTLHFANVRRGLGGPLLPGQTLMIDFDNYLPLASAGDEVGVQLGVDFIAGHYSYTDYVLSDPFTNEETDTGIRITDQGVHIELSALDGNTSRLSVTSFAPGGPGASFIVPYRAINDIVIGNTTFSLNRDPKDVYFNNIEITPEPRGLVGVFCLVAGGLILLRRRISSFPYAQETARIRFRQP